MLRATRALSALLMLGAFACTFEHGGVVPGSADGNVPDSVAGGDEGGDVGAVGSDGDDADPGADEGADDANPVDDGDRVDSPARPDGRPSDTDPNPDGGGADKESPDGSEPDARADCAAIPGGTAFT